MSSAHHFVIEPLVGVGPIRLGMHKEEVSRAFTYVYRSFFKTPASKVRADQCEVVGLIMHYGEDSHVNYIEIVKPTHGVVTVELFGQDITGILVQAFGDLLKAHADDVRWNGYGHESRKLGISTFNSDPRAQDAVVECIGCGPARPPHNDSPLFRLGHPTVDHHQARRAGSR